MQIKHVKSNTVADGGDANLVRPSDWNSSHNLVSVAGCFPLFQGVEVNKTFAAMSSMMSTILWQPMENIVDAIAVTRVEQLISMAGVSSATANTTYGGTLSRGLAFYSFNGQSLALHTSMSSTTAFSWTSNNWSNFVGIRQLSSPFNATLSPGNWWFAFSWSSAAARTNSTGGSVATTIANSFYSAVAHYSVSCSGDFGVASNANIAYYPYLGWYTAVSNAFPASVHTSDLVYTVATNVVGWARKM